MHAFGKPVVPEVYWKLAMPEGSSGTAGSAAAASASSPASSAGVSTSRTVPVAAATARTLTSVGQDIRQPKS